MADHQNSKQTEFGPNGAVLTGMSEELRAEYLKKPTLISGRFLRTGGLPLVSDLFIAAAIFAIGYLWASHDDGTLQRKLYELIPWALICASFFTDWLDGRIKKRRKAD